MGNFHERSFDELCPYIRDAGLQQRDSWRNRVRKIYDHQFMYCFKGSANVIIGEEQYSVQKGDLIIIPPNTPHQLWFDPLVSGELYWFHCDFFYYEDREWHYDFYQNVDTYITLFDNQLLYPEHIRVNPIFKGGYQFPHFISTDSPDEIEYLFRRVIKIYMDKKFDWQIESRICVLNILKYLISLDYKNSTHRKHYFIDTIKNFITHNYYRKLTIKEICKHVQHNPEYVAKMFKRETGESINQYVNRYRINIAKKLFLEVDLSLADIAEMVGFNNEIYFSQVFKKCEGETPSKIRESILELFNSAEL